MREVTLEYTLTRCASCGASARRYYRQGDQIFSEAERCPCGEKTEVELVYAETHRL